MEPFLRIERGNPDPAELAALTAVLATVLACRDAARASRSHLTLLQWPAPVRRPPAGWAALSAPSWRTAA